MDWCSLVLVASDIDIASYRELEETLACCDFSPPVCVDFSACPYMDSSGLGLMLRMRKAHADFWIVAPIASAVKRLSDLAGVSTYLQIYASLDEVRLGISERIST